MNNLPQLPTVNSIKFYFSYPSLLFIRSRLASTLTTQQTPGLTKNILVLLGVIFYFETAFLKQTETAQNTETLKKLLDSIETFQTDVESILCLPVQKTKNNSFDSQQAQTFFSKAKILDKVCVQILQMSEEFFPIFPDQQKSTNWFHLNNKNQNDYVRVFQDFYYTLQTSQNSDLMEFYESVDEILKWQGQHKRKKTLRVFTSLLKLYKDVQQTVSENKNLSEKQVNQLQFLFPQLFDSIYFPVSASSSLKDFFLPAGSINDLPFFKKLGYSKETELLLREKQKKLETIFQQNPDKFKQFFERYNQNLVTNKLKPLTFNWSSLQHGFFLNMFLTPLFKTETGFIWNPPLNSVLYSPWSLQGSSCSLNSVGTTFIQTFRSLLYQPSLGTNRSRASIIKEFLNADETTGVTPERLQSLPRSIVGYFWLDFKIYQLECKRDQKTKRVSLCLKNGQNIDIKTQRFLSHFLLAPYSNFSYDPEQICELIVPEFCGVINCSSAYEMSCLQSRLDFICPLTNQYTLESFQYLQKKTPSVPLTKLVFKKWASLFFQLFPLKGRDPLWVRLPHKKSFEDLELALPLLETIPHSGCRFFSLQSKGDTGPFVQDFELYSLIKLKLFVTNYFKLNPNDLAQPLANQLKNFEVEIDQLIEKNLSPKKDSFPV